MSQFAYVHNDNILLGLAVARKPCVSILSVAGSDIRAQIFLVMKNIFQVTPS